MKLNVYVIFNEVTRNNHYAFKPRALAYQSTVVLTAASSHKAALPAYGNFLLYQKLSNIASLRDANWNYFFKHIFRIL